MNLVSLLIVSAVVKMSVGENANTPLRLIIAILAVAGIATAVIISKRRPVVLGDDDSGTPVPPPAAPADEAPAADADDSTRQFEQRT
jgi:K(+)-stimulated pyrophosphate-energized sodium pump